jgi:flagella basal body P-ring formation protein FlgA
MTSSRSLRWATGLVFTAFGLSLPTATVFAAAGTGDATRVRLELRPDAQVRQQQVTLGEVANLSSRDLSVLRRLMALPIGTVPRSGEAVTLEREALLQWLKRRNGVEENQIEWQGPAANSVRLAVNILSGEQVAAAAQRHLKTYLASGRLRADIDLAQVPRDVSVPGGRLELRPRALGGHQDASTWSAPSLPRRQIVWMDVWVDERFVRTVAVGFDVNAFGPGLVASEDLPAGRLIDPARPLQSQLLVHDIDWSGRRSAPIAARVPAASVDLAQSPTQVSEVSVDGALRLRRPLAAGQVLTRADVEAAPLIARGEYALLRTTQGPIALESRVEVLQDGAAGQSVRVKLPNASTSIMARVVGAGVVEVRQ